MKYYSEDQVKEMLKIQKALTLGAIVLHADACDPMKSEPFPTILNIPDADFPEPILHSTLDNELTTVS